MATEHLNLPPATMEMANEILRVASTDPHFDDRIAEEIKEHGGWQDVNIAIARQYANGDPELEQRLISLGRFWVAMFDQTIINQALEIQYAASSDADA